MGWVAVLMGKIAKCVAVLAAFSVLLVLITPAPDELPCTTGHKSLLILAVLANATSALMQWTRPIHRPVFAADRFLSVLDVRSLTCTFLC